ncbi:hypothetical protein D3C85_1009000 [compost metagenome]
MDREELCLRAARWNVDDQVSRLEFAVDQVVNRRSHHLVMPVHKQPITLEQFEPDAGEVKE